MSRRTWSDEQLARAIAASTTWGQVCRAVGLKGDSGTASRSIRARATELRLDTSHFLGKSWNKGHGTGRNAELQRKAKRRWYQDNKQVYLDRNRLRYEEKSRKLRELKSRPCMDCGGTFPAIVMDFDHRDDVIKMGNVGNLIKRWSWEHILSEIAKCDLICANCHRIRTARRAGWIEDDMTLLEVPA